MTNDQTSPLDTPISLIGWGDYDTLEDQIVARTFGHMIRLASPVVKEYHSDLFIDAMNLRQILRNGLNQIENGTSFYWAVRNSGTWFESMALTAASDPALRDSTLILYHIEVGCDERQSWFITITDETNNAAELAKLLH